MESPETLHSFVLHLLSSSEARQAFQLNPEAVLRDAGLGDIDALDVQEVIPLVIDYAPLSNVAGLDALTDILPAAADVGHLGAIHQLQAVAQHLPLGAQAGGSSGADVSAASIGALAASPGGLPAAGLLGGTGDGSIGTAVTSETGAGAGGEFSAEYDVTGDLDAGLLPGTLPDLVSGPSEIVTDLPGDATGLLSDLPDTLTGTLDGVTDTLGGVTGALDGTLGDVTGTLGGVTGTLDGVTGTLDGVTGTLDGVTGTLDGVTGGLTGALSGSVNAGTSVDVSSDATLPVGNVLDGAGVGTVTQTADQLLSPVTGLLDLGD